VRGQPDDDESGQQACGLSAPKKTLAASQRGEQERTQWPEQMKQVDAKPLVVAKACGSNIALTPLFSGTDVPL
jgi:hypothetical protein